MTKLIFTLTVALGAVAFTAAPAAASCTWDYITCLNDTYDLTGATQTMADIECFGSYVGCLINEVSVW